MTTMSYYLQFMLLLEWKIDFTLWSRNKHNHELKNKLLAKPD